MKKTIVCVGCSWTYGYGVEADQTYPAHLQNILSDYTVINAGHCGVDIDYAIFSAVRLIEEYNPCFVIFQMTTLDRATLGTDGYSNFLNGVFYDGREDLIYVEPESTQYIRLSGIGDNTKTKFTPGSYLSSDDRKKIDLKKSNFKNTDVEQYKTFISTYTENIIYSNYSHQRTFNTLFLFQQYLINKKINSLYFYWVNYKGSYKESTSNNFFNSNNIIEEPVDAWIKNQHSNKNLYIDNGYHLSSEGNKLLAEEYLFPYIKKLL
jgi:hypothetical protein